MKCKQCNQELEASKGKKPRLFCSDAHRKAYKRTQDKKRTEQTDTSSIPVETLEMVDAACGDKMSQPPKPQSYNSMMVGYVPPEG